MRITIFDTETTSLEKPFCYNIGYVIYDTETGATLTSKDFVVEQIWHNPELFSTAYYAAKRPIYVARMRSRATKMNKYGYICQEMARDFKAYGVEMAFAYNSAFDEKVFAFNCEWFKCINPFDNIPIKDIRAFAHKYLMSENYFAFCEANQRFTESGNYSTTAETMFQYISGCTDFTEEHTALNDSIIECAILVQCLENGADLNDNIKAKMSIPRKVAQTLTIIDNDKNEYYFDCYGYTVYKGKNVIRLK